VNGYGAIILFYADGTAKADFSRIVGGNHFGTSNWFYTNTATFSVASSENVHAIFTVSGSTLSLSLWRVGASGGSIVETPIPFYNGTNTLTATDTTYTSAGLPGLLRWSSAGGPVLFDDVSVNLPASGYLSTGTLTSTAIAPAPWLRWGALAFTRNTAAAGTALTVDVLNSSGALLAANVPTGTNLNSLPAIASQPSIRLRANLSTTDSANTPRLDDWTVNYVSAAAYTLMSAWSNVTASTQDATAPAVAVTSAATAGTVLYTLTGTASDSSGVSSLTVNGQPAITGNGFVDWSLPVTLQAGVNNFTIVASDGVLPLNVQTVNHVVTLLPAVGDGDGDGLPDAWETLYGLDPANATGANGALGDPDGDGRITLLELALGSNPIVADNSDPTSAWLVRDPNDGQSYLTWQYRRLRVPGWLEYHVETSTDLRLWHSGPGSVEEVGSPTPNADGLTETVTIRALPAVGPTVPACSVRLRVTVP
jgi:hypothetical protein